MESNYEKMEEAYRKKISLLGTLLNCLNLERENLIHVDVKGLWSSMEEKQRILASIQETEEAITKCKEEDPGEETPERRLFRNLSGEIRRLKLEIGARVKENVSFIEETLQFFDEIVSIFASGKRPEYGYEPANRRPKIPSSLIFESEV